MPYLRLSVQPKNIKPNFRLLGFLVGAIFGFLLVFSFSKYQNQNNNSSKESTVLSYSDKNLTANDNPKDLKTLGVLLLGYGGPGHEGGFLTDAIQVILIDFEKAKVNLISVPRDLWVKLPSTRETKINGAFSSLAGKSEDLVNVGGKAMKDYLGKLLGLKLDYFLAIDFVGFQRAIGINLKGIEVEVGQTLDDPWFPIQGRELDTCGVTASEVAELTAKYSGFELERQFPCRYEHLYFEKGIVNMQGGEALKYVRSRHGSSAGDLERGIRQQEVLTAIKKRIFNLQTLEDLPAFFKDVSVHVKTDINSDIVNYLLPLVQKAQDFKINNINLSTANVLTTGNIANTQIIRPKAGLYNWTGIQNFISK